MTPWTFKITSLLNLNENQFSHHLDLSMIEGFYGFLMFSLPLSKIGWILLSNVKETLQNVLAIKCLYCGKHKKIRVNSIIEATQFLPWNQVKHVLTECFWQDTLKYWWGKTIQVWLTLDIKIMLLETKKIQTNC